jgi:hypothetical protein
MFAACSLPAHCLFIAGNDQILLVRDVTFESPTSPLIPYLCSLPIHDLFTACSLPVHCLFTAYSPIDCLLVAYSLSIHCEYEM